MMQQRPSLTKSYITVKGFSMGDLGEILVGLERDLVNPVLDLLKTVFLLAA